MSNRFFGVFDDLLEGINYQCERRTEFMRDVGEKCELLLCYFFFFFVFEVSELHFVFQSRMPPRVFEVCEQCEHDQTRIKGIRPPGSKPWWKYGDAQQT